MIRSASFTVGRVVRWIRRKRTNKLSKQKRKMITFLLFSLFFTSVCGKYAVYNETEAHDALFFAAGAYCNSTDWSCYSCVHGSKNVSHVTMMHGSDDTEGVALLDHTRKQLVLAFRGAFRASEWPRCQAHEAVLFDTWIHFMLRTVLACFSC